jgi:uncharacterized protein (TIGR02145 family)
MKKSLTILATLLITGTLFLTNQTSAQTPQMMSYQCVVRNNSGALVQSKAVSIRISILQLSSTGTAVYIETQSVTTNANGLASLEIGGGTILTGTFAAINWGTGPYFLKTETDPDGGTNYSIVGVSQLLSVPYSQYAKTAGNGFSGNYNDLTNKPTTWSWLYITNTPTTLYQYGITDAVDNHSDQSIAGAKTFTGIISAGSNTITHVATPVNTTDAANKAYVDDVLFKLLQLEAAPGVTDYDGNHYNAVQIGSQVWMAANLKTTHYSDGTAISNITDNTLWDNAATGAYCWYANNTSSTYGAMYNYNAAVDSRNICPTGWHVPSFSELQTLVSVASGAQLKEAGTSHWTTNTGATNSSGFTALPGGLRMADSGGNFIGLNTETAFLSTTLSGSDVELILLSSNTAQVNYSSAGGFSVRCLKN